MSDTSGSEHGTVGTWGMIEAELDCLTNVMRERYRENEHRPDWFHEEARWHFYKAADQISIANYHYRNNGYDLFQINMADALNHLIMGCVIASFDPENEGCHPVMDRSLDTDNDHAEADHA